MPAATSMHIGVNLVDPAHYGGWSGPLNACEADAEDTSELARSAGFDVASVLLTRAATRAAVIDGIRAAATTAAPGDLFLLSYAGHGGQVPDLNGDETDLQDETWCLYDGQLIDDELDELFAAFQPGVRVLVLSDSCHSGTVTRMAYEALTATGAARGGLRHVEEPSGPVYRTMPDEVALRTFRQNRSFYHDIASALPARASEVRATVRLISGCQDNQLSLDGTFNGLFTATLLRVWADGAFQGDYRRFHKAIVRRMPPTQTPNHFITGRPNAAYDAQRPFEI